MSCVSVAGFPPRRSRGHQARVSAVAQGTPGRDGAGQGPGVEPHRYREVIRRFQERELSHRAIGSMLGAVRQVLAYGISAGLLSVNVAASVKAPRKQQSKAPTDTKPKDEPWTHEELLHLRAVSDQDEWAAVWRLTLCGLRRSEIMGLKWDAVDLDRGEVRIEAGRVLIDGRRTATDDPKSKASQRSVPVEDIQPGTIALLRGP